MNHVFPTMVIVGFIKKPMLEMGLCFRQFKSMQWAIIVGNVKIHGDSLIDGRVIISGYNMEIDCTKIFQIYDDYSVHISETI